MNDLLRSSDVRDIERRDLLDQLESRERAFNRHATWALLGVSPGAVVPFLVSVSQLGAATLVGAVVLMTGLEGWRALRAKRDVADLERALAELRAEE